MLGLFFPRARKPKQSTPDESKDPCKKHLAPNSCAMKKQAAAATTATATAAAAAAATTATATASHQHNHHHHHHHHHSADATPVETALLADLAEARAALEAAGEAEAAGGAAAIAKAVESIAGLRARWRKYSACNATDSAAAAKNSGKGSKAGAKAAAAASASGGGAPHQHTLTAKEKLELNEMGLRAQLALDGVEAGGRADVRALRKRATVCAERFLDEVQAAPEAAARPTPPSSPRN